MENAVYAWFASLGLSPLNTVLLGVIALLARQRIQGVVSDLSWAQKQLREHETTFVKYGMEVQREPERD